VHPFKRFYGKNFQNHVFLIISKSADGSSGMKWAGHVARMRRRGMHIEYSWERKKGLLGRPKGR
jgi:hypothetical protein